MEEAFIKDEKLIAEEEWHSYIDKLREEVDSLMSKKEFKKKKYEELREDLKKAIVHAVDKRMPSQKFAIFFSGGVDSSTIALICKQLKGDFTCYTVGYKTEESEMPRDLVYAHNVANSINVKLVSKEFNERESKKIIDSVIRDLPKAEKVDAGFIVNVGVASVVVAAKSIASEKVFFSGLGSEEIFAGYQRHLDASEKHEECWSGLKKMWARDLLRDCTIGSKLGIELRTPLLDEEVMKKAMMIDVSKKINSESKKIVFRGIAEELGLDKEYAWRKKLGAQYGSKFDRAISKLAKSSGLKYKKEYVEKVLGK